MLLGDPAEVTAHNLQFGGGRNVVVVVAGVEHLVEGAPLALLGVVERIAAHERHEVFQQGGFSVDVGDGACHAVVGAPGGDDLLGQAFGGRSVASARCAAASGSRGVQVVFG